MNAKKDQELEFFSLENDTDEMVFHEWYSCKFKKTKTHKH